MEESSIRRCGAECGEVHRAEGCSSPVVSTSSGGQESDDLPGQGELESGRSIRVDSHRRRKRQSPPDTTCSLIAGSYSRYSSSLQREESITDQQRKCREAAEKNQHTLLPEWEFADEAISGTKRDRAGLNAMLKAAQDGRFKVLYLFSLSRLARESVITLPILKRLVHTFGVRLIIQTEGIDSSRGGWELIAAIFSAMHDRYIKDLSRNVLSGQEGALLQQFSVGDWCFGYGSQPIPGSEQSRGKRNAKPRMICVINAPHADWVVQIFDWFVRENRSLRWIVRELNRLNAPKDHRSTT